MKLVGMRFAGTLAMPKLPRRRTNPTPPRIVDTRGLKIVLDEDLARLYGVTTARLNQAVQRNAARFPADFAFQLSAAERQILRSQSVISSGGHGGRRTHPWAFTEHGAIMAATVLRSARAIEMSIFVVRAFVQLRDVAAAHRELAMKLSALERRVTGHDEELKAIIAALRQLIVPPLRQRRRIGFFS
jgi:ORF6N domain.